MIGDGAQAVHETEYERAPQPTDILAVGDPHDERFNLHLRGEQVHVFIPQSTEPQVPADMLDLEGNTTTGKNFRLGRATILLWGQNRL